MKKFLIAGLSALILALALVSCGSEEPKPTPQPNPASGQKLEVLLNGQPVKDGSVVDSKGLHLPQTKEELELVEAGMFDYDFINLLTLKTTDESELGAYTVELEKIGGAEVAGKLFQVCLIGKSCTPVDNNKFDKENTFELSELGKEAGYKIYYRLEGDEYKKAVDAQLSAKVMRGSKLISKFTIKMTNKPS